MKKQISFILLTAFVIVCKAQSITPQVVASDGAHSSGTNLEVSWTLGEPAVTTLTATNTILTQGFHQPQLNITGIGEQNTAKVNLRVFPNPSADQVTVSIDNNGKDFKVEIFSTIGQLLQSRKINANEKLMQINVKEYAAANYIMRITSADHGFTGTYKIEKIN